MVLDLFPARVQFTDKDGRLTPAAVRALNLLFSRVGGTLGDSGNDTYASGPSASDYADVMALAESQALAETFLQPVLADELAPTCYQPIVQAELAPMDSQPEAASAVSEMVFAPTPDRAMSAVEAVTPGASPATVTADRDGYLVVAGGTVSVLEYVRAGSATDTGVVAGLFPILVGDAMTITYSSVPTVTFIPR
ncbi:MAG: hypothetical protein NUV51_10375 [Sulfuricaulis sp.]|nr:hypothetical protein [Sulfuricaulis sp.]